MLHPVQKAFKIRAYLTPDQRRAFAQAEGATRYVRRRVLTEMDGHFKATGTRKSLLDMGREVTQWKQQEETAWLKDIPSDVIIQELRDLKQAFENFFRALKVKQPGRKVGYPKPKRKSASGAIRFAFDHRHPGKVAGWTGKKVILPKLGMIKLAQPERLPLEMPKLVNLSRDSGGRFFISFSVKQTIEPLPEPGVSVGVDLGLIDLAVLSDGTRIPALKELKKKERYLSRQQRILSRRQGSKKGEKKSRRYLKQLRKVNRMHCRVADARRDYAHKASRAIIEKADVIALEDQTIDHKRCGHMDGKVLRPLDEALQRLDIALTASGPMQVIARTDASLFDGEAIRRVDAFIEAGARIVLVDGINERDLLDVIERVKGRAHLMANIVGGGKLESRSAEEFKQMGVSIVNLSTALLFPAMSAMSFAMRTLIDGDFAVSNELPGTSLKEANELMSLNYNRFVTNRRAA